FGLNDRVVTGLAQLTGDERFAYDSYRRLVQMFGSVVLGLPSEPFEEILAEARRHAGVARDSDLDAGAWRQVVEQFRAVVRAQTGSDFPQDPVEQVRLATI